MAVMGRRVLLVVALAFLGMAVIPAESAGAKTPKPTITNLAAAPTTVTTIYGQSMISASVSNATTCTVSSRPAVTLGAGTVNCSSGTVDQTMVFPENTSSRAVTYRISLSATGSGGTKSKDVKVKISPGAGGGAAPSITSANSTTFFDGVEGSFTITITGAPTPTISETGALPTGISFTSSGGSATLSGTPTQLGDFTLDISATNTVGPGASQSFTLTVELAPLSGVTSVASDFLGYCALLSSGGVECWGNDTDAAEAVTGLTNAVSITSDGNGYCALLSTGGMECWGDNELGQLGNGTIGGPDGTSGYETPQAVIGITNATSVSTDNGGYCAVLSTGSVECWGANASGDLGNGTVDGPDDCENGAYYGCYDTPQAVTGLTNAVSLTDDGYGGYCAVLSTGGVECWGDNSFGQLGNGTIDGPDGCDSVGFGDWCYDTPQAVTGLTNAVSVVSDFFGYDDGPRGYCAVLSSGGVECWGDNAEGGVGNGTIDGPDSCDNNNWCYDTPQAVSGLTDAISLSSDGESYCALLSSGDADCWGWNGFGEIGNGTIGGPAGGIGYDTPQAVTGLTDAVSVVGGSYGYCAVLSSGSAECWGDDANGELGNGSTFDDYGTPQAVTGLTEAVSITSDASGAANCALLSSSGMECWGSDRYGQLGNGTLGGPDGAYGYDIPQVVVLDDSP